MGTREKKHSLVREPCARALLRADPKDHIALRHQKIKIIKKPGRKGFTGI